MSVLSRLRRDEQGITLVEMLAAMSIGLVVLFAILGLFDTMVRSSAESHGRVNGVRDGRQMMDRLDQELRLASCPAVGGAVLSATADSLSYYVSRPAADFTQPNTVERHTLTYTPADRTMTLTVSPGAGDPPVWSATASRRTELGSNIARIGTTPIFQYLRYLSPDQPTTAPVAAPVAAAELSNIAQVRVVFDARSSWTQSDNGGSRFDSTIVLRTDDPTDQDNTPQC
jgi:Tfp pilus assembly protein PilW